VLAKTPKEARDISKILSLDEVYNIGTSFSLQPGIHWQRAVKALNHKHVLRTEKSTGWRDDERCESEEKGMLLFACLEH
jgi:hypothetical protein